MMAAFLSRLASLPPHRWLRRVAVLAGRGVRWGGGWWGLAILLHAVVGHAQSAGVSEYQLKAAVLVNLARFVEWPTNTWAAPNAPFVLGLVGDDPFGSVLDSTTRDQTVQGRRLVVRRFGPEEDVRRCQLLFVSQSERRKWPTVFDRLKEARVLTVSETSQFAHQGGMVNLVMKEEMVRFEVNLQSVQRHGLHISSRLLKYATVVKPLELPETR